MKKQLFYFCLLIFILICFSSCSVSFEKRRYRPGYYVSMVKPVVKREPSLRLEEVVKTTQEKPVFIETIKENRLPQTVVLQSERKLISIKPHLVVIKLSAQHAECDMVYFKNGKSMMVTDVRVVEDKLFYNNCGDNHNKVVPVSITRIKNIKLANGTVIDPNKDYRDMIRKNEKESAKKNSPATRIVGAILMGIIGVLALGLAVFLIIFGLSVWIIGIILVIIGGIVAITAIVLIVMAFVTGFRRG